MQSHPQMDANAHARGLEDYIQAGSERALSLGNRGPMRYDENGNVHPDILTAYWQHGFYVFEGMVSQEEVAALRADVEYLIDHAPVGTDAEVDRFGRPALRNDQYTVPTFSYIKPLSDPWGGGKVLQGRHPIKMVEPLAEKDAPEEVLFLIHGMCLVMPAGLRLYGHHDILSVAQAINGEDFTPFNDILFVKPAGLGGSVSWHQDGVTHWDSPDWDEGIHGFNVQVQLYECTAHNALWVMPGSHKEGRADIKALVAANGGSEQLPGAVPLLCQPGDTTIVNRQALHCSFANTSPHQRVSVTYGFHRYASVLGAHGALSQSTSTVYDEARIHERASVIQVAIDARAQHYPDEPRFSYAPFRGLEDQYRYDEATYKEVLHDYNLKDLSI